MHQLTNTVPKQVLLSPSLMETESLQQLSALVEPHSNITLLSAQSDRNLHLKLALLFHRSMKQGQGQGASEGAEKWVLCNLGDWESGRVGTIGRARVCVVVEDRTEVERVGDGVFLVSSTKQAIDIVTMNAKQLQIRQRMQKILGKSTKIYKKNSSQTTIANFADKLISKTTKQQISNLSRQLSYVGRWRLKRLRRYFTQWAIWYYQSSISRRQSEIVSGQLILYGSNRTLLRKCLQGWKYLCKKHTNP